MADFKLFSPFFSAYGSSASRCFLCSGIRVCFGGGFCAFTLDLLTSFVIICSFWF